jgi:fused signal recognition particle receptor
MGFFDKIRESLARTKQQFSERFEEIVQRADSAEAQTKALDLDTVEALEEALISADVGVAATEQIVEAVKARKGRGDSLRTLVRAEILSILRGADAPPPNGQRPHVVMVVGVNGTGKTTTTGKLARVLVAQEHTVLLGAADTFRAAAADQLQTWSERVGAEVVRGKEGADPAAVAFDAVKRGIDTGVDLDALIEAASMAERVVGRELPSQVLRAGPRTRLSPS